MWLGVPFGTDAFVEAELRRQIRDHDKRLRGVAAYAGCDGAAVSHKGVRLSRQLAIAALKFSANARDVHFLRSLGRRAVGEAAELHDAGVSQGLAVILGQAKLPEPAADGTVQPLCERPLVGGLFLYGCDHHSSYGDHSPYKFLKIAPLPSRYVTNA